MKAHHLLSLSGFLTMHQLLTNICVSSVLWKALVLFVVFFCGIWATRSIFFLKFIGHSMVDSIQISTVKTAISGLQSFGHHGEPTEPYRYLIRASQGTLESKFKF